MAGWAVFGVAVVVLAVEPTLVWDQLAKAWKSLYRELVVGTGGGFAAMLSMHSFAQIQRKLLRSVGVGEAAAFGGGLLRGQRAEAPPMPGGPVLSATFIYRRRRNWVASPVVASWQLVMSGALLVVGLALLGLGGAFLLGAGKNPFSLIFTLAGSSHCCCWHRRWHRGPT